MAEHARVSEGVEPSPAPQTLLFVARRSVGASIHPDSSVHHGDAEPFLWKEEGGKRDADTCDHRRRCSHLEQHPIRTVAMDTTIRPRGPGVFKAPAVSSGLRFTLSLALTFKGKASLSTGPLELDFCSVMETRS